MSPKAQSFKNLKKEKELKLTKKPLLYYIIILIYILDNNKKKN
jgi:hypothetical protein